MKKNLGALHWEQTDPLVRDSVTSPLAPEDREALAFQKKEAEAFLDRRRQAFRSTRRSMDTRSPFPR
jgi:hypothetical protein